MSDIEVFNGSDVDFNATNNVYTLGEIRQGESCCAPSVHMSVNKLSVAYGEKVVLADVSLDIHKGCVTALIGPSGCGKSSFLAALNRLTDFIPNSKVKGEIFLDGEDILRSKTELFKLRKKVGMIFQRPNPFPLSIRKNLELPLKENGMRCKLQIKKRIQEVLSDVGLWEEVKDRLDSPALQLSGGQQQRLCIARALTLEPEVLLMDEPCSALDPISSAVVEDLVLRLVGRFTVVIVTHNLAQAKRIANYAAFFWMKEKVGKLIEFGCCQPLFESPSDPLTASYISGLKG